MTIRGYKKTNGAVLLLSICILAGALLLTSCELNYHDSLNNGSYLSNGLTFPEDPRYRYTYPVAEYLGEETYEQYLSDDGTRFRSLLGFYDALVGSEQLTFASFAGNTVELLNVEVPRNCVEEYGTEFEKDSYYKIEGEPAVATKAIQVFEPFLDLFPLEIEEGRDFTESDYHFFQNKRVPVILGSAYKDSYHIGDVFEGYYIFERVAFEVVGIAKSGGVFYNKQVGGLDLYDSFIIMPFAKVTTDSPFGRIVLLQEICGFMTAENGRDAAEEQYRKYLINSGLSDWQEQIVINTKAIR